MPPVSTLSPEIEDAVRRQVEEILQQRGGTPFTPEIADQIDTLDAQVKGLLQDESFGQIVNGPTWISGLSVIDGSVTADKLSVNTVEAVTSNTGTLNVTGTITAAASYPAFTGERIEITSSSLTLFNSSDQETVVLNVDGSGTIGLGSSQISWTTGGAVTVPNAAISSLTIADIGSGTFNSNFDAGTGRVRAGTALQRVELTSSGLAAYDSGGSQTFFLDATDGSLTHTGVHTIRSASSGARTEIANVGIRAFNSGGTQTFNINSSDGSGYLGADQLISWGTSTVTIDGDALVSGTVTAGKLNVTNLSSVSANMGTLTAGSITGGSITADTISSGTLDGTLLGLQTVLTNAIDDLGITSAKIASGAVTNAKIDTVEAGKLTSDTITSTTITLGTGGKLQWESGNSYIDDDGITLYSISSSFGDSVRWATGGGTTVASARYVSGQFVLDTTGDLYLAADRNISNRARIDLESGSTGRVLINAADEIQFSQGGLLSGQFDTAGRFVAEGNIFPQGQINRYLTDNGTHLGFGGMTTGGSTGSWSSNAPAGASYMKFVINGTVYRFAFWADS